MPKKPLFSRAIWDAIRSQYIEGYPINALASAYGISYGQLFAKKRDDAWPKPASTQSLSTLPPLVVYKEERPAETKTMVLSHKHERIEVKSEEHAEHILPKPYANMERKISNFPALPDNPLYTPVEHIHNMTPEQRAAHGEGCDARAANYHKEAMEITYRLQKRTAEIIDRANAGESVPLEQLDLAFRTQRNLGLDKIPLAKAQGPSTALQVVNNNQAAGTGAGQDKAKRIAIPL